MHAKKKFSLYIVIDFL